MSDFSVRGAITYSLIFATLIAAGGVQARAQDTASDPLDGFQSYLDQLLADFNVPGAAVAVIGVEPDPCFFVAGVTAAGAGKAVTSDTSFHVASITKTFNATMAAVLVDEGLVDWDTPVRKIIPEFELEDPVATANATLRDLLAHRTGMGRNSVPGFNRTEDPSWWLPRLRHLEPEGDFRDKDHYSGVMVTVAGLLLERAADTPWEQLLEERLLEPLGMTRTTVGPPGEGDLDLARPHLVIDGEPKEIEPIVSSPDAFQSGLYSSAHDMAGWMQFLLDDGRIGDRALVSPGSLAETWTPQMAIRRRFNPRTSSVSAYGLGWRISTRHNSLELSHGGGGAGSTAHMLLIPQRDLAVIVLTNAAINPVPDLACNWILNRVFGVEAPDPREGAIRMVERMAEMGRAAKDEALAEEDPDAPAPLPFSACAGTYADFVFGTVEIGAEASGLTVRYHGVDLEVDHLHGNVYLLSSPFFDSLRSEFAVSPEGLVTAITIPIGPGGSPVVFKRQPEPDSTQ